ncbi:MAG: hypothetical protein OXN25_11005 [Candidatus Poribacteria bacterium]|nr:hypothetical protein [Candidatus Poribacteria bacterium]
MKIRVTDRNKQQDEICFEDIMDILIVPYGDERIRLQIWVDTIDRKDLYVAENDISYLLFLFFHCERRGNKRPEVGTAGKTTEFEEIFTEFRNVYLRYHEQCILGL